MSSDNWAESLNGNWHDAFNWTEGTPNSTSDVVIDADGNYVVSLTDAAAVDSVLVDAAQVTLLETAQGSLVTTGVFEIESGTVVLRGTNTFGSGISLAGGTLRVANADALGAAAISAEGGTLVFTVDETLANSLVMGDMITLAAAHGKTLDFGSSAWTVDNSGSTVLSFGTPSADGTVILNGANGTTTAGDFQVHVLDGKLQEGDSTATQLLANASTVNVAQGARLDLAGFATTMTSLGGAGTIVNSGAATTLVIEQGVNFSGSIKGAIAVEFAGAETDISGAQTYTGGTTIDAGDTLFLNDGGSLSGNITVGGELVFNHTGSFDVANAISGTGTVSYSGGGTYSLNRAENYSGGTSISGGELEIDNSGAFGTGDLEMFVGAVIAEAKVALTPGSLNLLLANEFAAAHGKSLTIDPTALTINCTKLLFGGGNNDGAVVLAGQLTMFNSGLDIEVQSGTLRAGNDTTLTALLDDGGTTTVASGATLALGGFETSISDLAGTGTVTNFGGVETILLSGHFGGVIAGKTAVQVEGPVIFTGTNTYTGRTTIDSLSELSLGNGGKSGSVAGNIADNGILSIDHSNAFAESAFISGTGQLVQRGAGVTTIDRGEAYTGGTAIADGVLSVDRAAAVGTGAITLAGGKLLVTQDATFDNDLVLSRGSIAAATGTTATFTAGGVEHLSSGILVFGDATHAGTIDWASNASTVLSLDADLAIEVRGGTLKGDGTELESLVSAAGFVMVDSGAKLNIVHELADFRGLSGSGTLTGAADGVAIVESGSFAGAINGGIDLTVEGTVTLSGPIDTTGAVTMLTGSHLILDEATSHDITFNTLVAGPADGDSDHLIVAGNAVLVLTNSDSFSGTIDGFANGSVIDLRDFVFSDSITKHFNANTDVLTISDGTHVEHIAFNADFAASDFKISEDSHGGTEIVAHFPVAPLSDHPAYLELG